MRGRGFLDWALKKEMKERRDKERGFFLFPAGTRMRVALAYPNSYFVGMSNLGMHIIYDLLNKRDDVACERFFLPDRRDISRYENTKTPLISVESQTPLYEFDVIAFAISFEMDYFHVIKMLQLGRVPVKAEERKASDPILIAGGPCPTFNPEPLSAIFDAFVIGEGEVIVPQMMDVIQMSRVESWPRQKLLEELAKVPGVYVPRLYHHEYDPDGKLISITPVGKAPSHVSRQWVKDLDEYPAHTVVLTDDTEFNFYLIETARGCGRQCRFCMAGYCFRRPRNRSLSVIEQEVREALPYQKKIGLMGAAISDYPEIDALCKNILGTGLSMSVASFRADSVTEELVESLAASGLKTITIAPEAGSARMRAIINKGIEEHHVFETMHLGIRAGIRNFKLYIMIGLPGEEVADIDAIIDMAERLEADMLRLGCRGTLTLSINPFVPKPFTPFQWEPMAQKRYIESSIERIKRALKKHKRILVHMESIKEANIQAILARGDRRVGEALILAARQGGSKMFRRAMKECRLSEEEYLYREREETEHLPWAILDQGVTNGFLVQEREKAFRLEKTLACFEGCHRCGVC